MREYRMKIAETIVAARELANVSQRRLAELLGRDKRTIQKWENGEIKLSLEDYLDIFDVLNVCVEPFSKWIRHPELFPNGLRDILSAANDRKRQALATYYAEYASPVEVEQEYYVLFGNHGSDYYGMRQQRIANLQTTLTERRNICRQIIENYNEALRMGRLTDPNGPQPIMAILEACYEASGKSIREGRNGYAVNHLPLAEEPEEEEE